MPETRPSKAITAREFNALQRPEQLKVLQQCDSRQRARLLVDAAAGSELMAELSVQDVYLTVRELGVEYLPEFLSLASPEQWTAFFDFDCWDGDEFDAAKGQEWLLLLLQSEEEQVVHALQRMNFELLVLLLKKNVQILAGPEDIDDDDARVEAVKRDGGYLIEYHNEDKAKLYGALIDLLFRNEPDFFRYLMETARAETESMIEESVYQQRSSRLLDIGLCSAFEAQGVYAWLDPDLFDPTAELKATLGATELQTAPSFALALVPPEGLLAEVLAAGVSPDQAWEVACLVNKVAMADQVDFGEVDEMRSVIEKTFGILNLALEVIAANDAEIAGRVFDDVYVERLFRYGYSATLRLQKRARVIKQSAIGAYLDGPFRALVDALLQKQPLVYEGILQADRSGLRHFNCLNDVRECEEWLTRLEVQQALFAKHFNFELPAPDQFELTGCQMSSAEDLTLSDLFLTSLANRVLGRDFTPEPVFQDELPGLHGQVCRSGKIDPLLREQTLAWLDSLIPGGSRFGDYCFDLWDEEFCAVNAEDLDPRYVGGLIVRLS